MKRRPAHHAPDRVSRAYNETQAVMKIATAPLATLTDSMVESIARTHRVSETVLHQRLAERRQREGVSG